MALERVDELLELDEQIEALRVKREELRSELLQDAEIIRLLRVLGVRAPGEATATVADEMAEEEVDEAEEEVDEADEEQIGDLTPGTLGDRIIRAMRDHGGAPMGHKEIAQEIGANPHSVATTLNRLIKRGYAERVGASSWVLRREWYRGYTGDADPQAGELR